MTVTLYELTLYAGAMALLWMVPGPVWVALTARSLSGGFAAAWPLALGVAIGDALWPLLAILGLSWVVSLYSEVLVALRWAAAATFVVMGVMLLRAPANSLTGNARLTKPGRWAGFAVGVAAVIGNPKAIFFYMTVLPGFFELSTITWVDTVAILVISTLLPVLGNLGLALFLDRARALLSSPESLRRLNVISGCLLICVGIVIALT